MSGDSDGEGRLIQNFFQVRWLKSIQARNALDRLNEPATHPCGHLLGVRVSGDILSDLASSISDVVVTIGKDSDVDVGRG